MKRDRWTRSTKVLRAALNEVLSAEGREIDPYGDALMKVQVVTVMSVRKEFLKKYLADGEDAKKNADAKRNAFNRALMTAQDRGLICGREIDGVDHLWLATDHS